VSEWDGIERRQMHDTDRLNRIEHIVVELEADMKVTSNAVKDLAESVKQLVTVQTEQQLLKKEVEHKCAQVRTEFNRLDKELGETNAKCDESRGKFEEHQRLVEPVAFMLRYPKVALMMFVGMYLMSIKEIRDSLLFGQ